jgi:hypothetical protein
MQSSAFLLPLERMPLARSWLQPRALPSTSGAALMGEALGMALGGAFGIALGGALGMAPGGALGMELDGAFGEQALGESLGEALGASLGEALHWENHLVTRCGQRACTGTFTWGSTG